MGEQSTMKYHYPWLLLYSPYKKQTFFQKVFEEQNSFFKRVMYCIDMGHIQVGSLAGAAHLLKDNAGVQRLAQIGQKPIVADKANS